MYRNYDLRTFFVMLLPPLLRRDCLKAFLWVLLTPLNDLSERFKLFANDADMRLSHNGFTIYLEKFLNDIFQSGDKIFIRDIIDTQTVYMWRQKELPDFLYMSQQKEETNTIYLTHDTQEPLRGRFSVCIPVSMDSPETRRTITQWCNYFKFAGTNFIIETY